MSNLDIASYNRQGKVFNGANVAAKNHIVVGTSETGLGLTNPWGSGKKVIMVDFGFAATSVSTAVTAIGLAVGLPTVLAPTSFTKISIQGADSSGINGGSVCTLWDAATFVTAPISCRWSFGNLWVTGGAGDHPYQMMDRIEGAIVLVPGASIVTAVLGATQAGVASFTWIEVPA
jgi:hypothetical protein